MARQFDGRNGEIVVIDGEDGPEEKPNTEHDRAAQDLIDHLGELGEGFSVTVHRVPNGNNQTEEYCFRCPADKFDPSGLTEHIREFYGAGDYRVRVWKNGAKGARQNKLITIARPAPGTSVAPVAVDTGKGEIAAVLNTLIAMQQKQAEENRALLERLTNRPDPRVEMAGTLALMKDMREAMGLGGAAPAAAAAAPVDPINSLVTTLAGFAKLKGLAGEMGFLPGEAREVADEPSIVGALQSFAPKLLEVWQRQQDLKAAELQSKIVTAPGERPAPIIPPARPALPPEAEKLLAALQGMAEQDADVEGIAEALVTDPRPRPFLEMLCKAESPFKMLAQYWPGALDYPSWWADLLDAVDEKLTMGTPPVQNPGNNHANPENPANGSTHNPGVDS